MLYELTLYVFSLIIAVYMSDCRERGGAKWETSLRDDIITECNQFGGVLHIYLDRDSEQGNVYIKCPAVATAISAVNALHGRFYAGQCDSRLIYLVVCITLCQDVR